MKRKGLTLEAKQSTQSWRSEQLCILTGIRSTKGLDPCHYFLSESSFKKAHGSIMQWITPARRLDHFPFLADTPCDEYDDHSRITAEISWQCCTTYSFTQNLSSTKLGVLSSLDDIDGLLEDNSLLTHAILSLMPTEAEPKQCFKLQDQFQKSNFLSFLGHSRDDSTGKVNKTKDSGYGTSCSIT
jgi:hypothetical protein